LEIGVPGVRGAITLMVCCYPLHEPLSALERPRGTVFLGSGIPFDVCIFSFFAAHFRSLLPIPEARVG
jgi:hypothetical protein